MKQRVVEWARPRTNRWLLAAVVVGFALRLAWAIWATRAPSGRYSDPAQYLQLAVGFADRRMPVIGEHATAFWPPGWPLTIAPFAWLSLKTGWISVAFAASLLNVAAGTATVAGTAALAKQWIGPASRNPAAWLMAVAPGPIYLTSSALSETWFTAVWVLTLLAATAAVRAGSSTRVLAAVGLAVGYAVLVRSPGVLLLAAPVLAIRATSGSWRGALRPTLAVAAGAAVLLVPWTVRNGVQVGVWTPTSTNNAAFLCIGNRPGATGVQELDVAEAHRCYRGSPFDDATLYEPGEAPPGVTFTRPDEPAWYRRTISDAIGWAVTNPARQPGLILRKTYETFSSDADALSAAEDFGRLPLVGTGTRSVLHGLADLWYWGTFALAALGLAFVPACRRALPLWALCALSTAAVWAGIGIARYHQPLLPLFAVFAAAALARRAARGRDGRDPSRARPSDASDAGRSAPGPAIVRLRDLAPSSRRLFGVLALAVALPFAVAAVAAARDGWVPVGDNARILIATRQVLTSHPPLTGEDTSSSRFGVTAHHPAPFVFEVDAPFVAVLGGTAGPLAATAAVGATATILVGYVALRQAGLRRALWAWCTTLALAMSVGGMAYLYDPFKSIQAVLPLLLFLYASWALIAGDVRLLALWVAAGSFAAAASVQYLTPIVPIAAGTAVAVVVARRRAGRVAPASRRGRAVLAASALVLLVAWWGPVVDVATNDGGNVTRLVRVARAGAGEVGLRQAARDTARALVGDPAATRTEALLSSRTHLLAATALTGAAGALVARRWRRLARRDRALVAAAAGALAVTFAGIAVQPTAGFGFVKQLGLSVAAGFGWFAAGSAIAPRRRLPLALPAVAVVALATVLSFRAPLDADLEQARWTYGAVPGLALQLRAGLGDEGTWDVRSYGPRSIGLVALGVAAALEEHGLDTFTERPPTLGGPLAARRAGDVLVLPTFLDLPTRGWETVATYQPAGRSDGEAAAAAAAAAAFARRSGARLSPLTRTVLPLLLCPELVADDGACPAADAVLAADDEIVHLPDAIVAILYVEQFDEHVPFPALETPAPDPALLDRIRRSWVDLPITVLVRRSAEASG